MYLMKCQYFNPQLDITWNKQLASICNTFYSSVTGLNNSDPDVMVTVTASNRAGQGNMSIPVRLPPSLGKYYNNN